MNRRNWMTKTTLCAAGMGWGLNASSLHAKGAVGDAPFRPKWMTASCMYGETALDRILREMIRGGSRYVDIWPRPHGNQREQIEAMGHEAFLEMINLHQIELGCLTRYDLGPFNLRREIRVAQKLGCHMIVTGSGGPKGLKGAELKHAVRAFVEKLKPQIDFGFDHGVVVAIENHGNSLIDHPDSMKWLLDMTDGKGPNLAIAPYHLESLGFTADEMGELIRALDGRIALFYAWQYGMGCMAPLPKEQELLQLPGRGPLDFIPVLNALRDTRFNGFIEVFMHPFPRGIPIHPDPADVTAAMVEAKRHLEALL